jgi:membrane fusion protein (multidrug efflux system)
VGSALVIVGLAGLLIACGSEAGGRAAATQSAGRGGAPRGGGGPGGRGGLGRGFPPDRPIPVEVVTVARGTVSRTATIAGILEPVRRVGVNAQLAGVLLSIRAEEGTRVRRGQPLAEMDTRELEAQERSAEASFRLAEANFKRSDQLFAQKIITAVEFDRDRAAYEAARATLDGLRTRIGYARIVAPLDGIVTEKRVEAGDVLTNNTRLFTIADVSMLVTRLLVSELEVRSLLAGDTVPMTVDALGGQRVLGRIRRVFPAADTATRLVPVEVALTGQSLRHLKPGYTVRATFHLDERTDALLVPSRAVSGPMGSRAVFLISAGKIARRAVSVGPDLDGRTEVFDGLQEGDSVIVSGGSMLREGALARAVGPLGDTASARARGGAGRDTATANGGGRSGRSGRGRRGGVGE